MSSWPTMPSKTFSGCSMGRTPWVFGDWPDERMPSSC